MPHLRTVGFSLLVLAVAVAHTNGDWARFRGPNGSGISAGGAAPPTEWGDNKNLKWKVELPGPGSSSPIVVGDRVFVTCWIGYGTQRGGDPGRQEDLKRVLLCLDRKTGDENWKKVIPAVLPEDRYGGMFAEHGYATHTPVSDGERVYVFFGKTGVLAFDMQGEQLWHKSVGTESGIRGWGTSSSPILYKDLLIVPATAESESLVAFNKHSGEQVWKKEAAGFSGTWGTPLLVNVDGRTDLVLAVPFEIWGFDPANGKFRWYAEGIESDSVCTSAIAEEGVVYVLGGRGGGAVAVRAGGDGEVTKSHTVWRAPARARIGTPIFSDGRLYWVGRSVANCIDAKSGDRIYQERLTGGSGNSGRTTGRRGGRGGGSDYSSPVVAGNNLYFLTRGGTAYVCALGDFKQLSANSFSDGGDFSATPAISDGALFIRSSKYLYCVAASN